MAAATAAVSAWALATLILITLLVTPGVKLEAFAATAPGATTGTRLPGTRLRFGITGGVTVFLVLLSVALVELPEVLVEPVLPVVLLPEVLLPEVLLPEVLLLELVVPDVLPLVLPEVLPLELPVPEVVLRLITVVVTPLLRVPAAAPPETVPLTFTFCALI